MTVATKMITVSWTRDLPPPLPFPRKKILKTIPLSNPSLHHSLNPKPLPNLKTTLINAINRVRGMYENSKKKSLGIKSNGREISLWYWVYWVSILLGGYYLGVNSIPKGILRRMRTAVWSIGPASDQVQLSITIKIQSKDNNTHNVQTCATISSKALWKKVQINLATCDLFILHFHGWPGFDLRQTSTFGDIPYRPPTREAVTSLACRLPILGGLTEKENLIV